MPEYLAPGVYIEEISIRLNPIEGQSTSKAAFLGRTERGGLKPQLVTSYGDYLRHFGGTFGSNNYMPYSVRAFFANGGRHCYITRIVGDDARVASVQLGHLMFAAVGPGAAYDRVWIRISPGSTKQPDGSSVGFRVQIDYWADEADVPVDESGIATAAVAPATSEDFDDLNFDPASPAFYGARINGPTSRSQFVNVSGPIRDDLPLTWSGRLSGGLDGGAVTSVHFEGTNADPEHQTGLVALDLDQYRDVSIVYAPAADYETAALIARRCEHNRTRFAVIDSLPNLSDATTIDPRIQIATTPFAAFYYPWYYAVNPENGQRQKLPPGGAICGIYSQTDNTYGVHKAPANVLVATAVDLEFDIDDRTQDILNPKAVNAIRKFPGRGIRVWGARTMADDQQWRYINVRRLFNFLESSIYNSTQWVVFEPNTEQLWLRVREIIRQFLVSQWREGALIGRTEDEAFFVNVGHETMTQDDVANGRLIIEIGAAPIRSAEFRIFRIIQRTQEPRE